MRQFVGRGEKEKIEIDLDELSLNLGVPVIGAAARSGKGLQELMDAVSAVSLGNAEPFRSSCPTTNPSSALWKA